MTRKLPGGIPVETHDTGAPHESIETHDTRTPHDAGELCTELNHGLRSGSHFLTNGPAGARMKLTPLDAPPDTAHPYKRWRLEWLGEPGRVVIMYNADMLRLHMFRDTDGTFYSHRMVSVGSPVRGIELTPATAVLIARIVDPGTSYELAADEQIRLIDFDEAFHAYRAARYRLEYISPTSHQNTSRGNGGSEMRHLSVHVDAALDCLTALGITREQALLALSLHDAGIRHPRELLTAVTAVGSPPTSHTHA